MNEGAVLKQLFGRVVAEYSEFLFYAWDDEREEVVGVGHATPAAWDRDPDGTHLDPWMRTHKRLGAAVVKVAPESVVVTGTVAEWEKWAEMAFPESGSYVVSGALVPIEIARERDEGIYVEPNVWMVHSPARLREPSAS